MLAEPKRKIIYSNPRGTLWANDKQKFGQRMLESMGWKEGKGLGKDENGITEHVKASFKFDNKGLGYQHKSNDWIEDNNVYEQILADLSKYHKTEQTTKEEPSNLEINSSNRLHFRKKFIKAKNLSQKSKTDMYCVFPRSKPNIDQHKDDKANLNDKDGGQTTQKIKTIQSNLTVQDYFQQKMKEKLQTLKKRKEPEECNINVEKSTLESDEEKKKKKRKNKSRISEEQSDLKKTQKKTK